MNNDWSTCGICRACGATAFDCHECRMKEVRGLKAEVERLKRELEQEADYRQEQNERRMPEGCEP